MAVLKATEMLSGHVVKGEEITLYVDSQAALKSLKVLSFKSRLVKECKKAIDMLVDKYKLD